VTGPGTRAAARIRYFDVLIANALATALSPRLAAGANRLRDVFLDPAEQALHPDWEDAAGGMVAGFRESVGTDTDDPRFIELVGELSLVSPRFSRLWARHDVEACEGAPKHIDHPQVGDLRLNRERLGISGTTGQMLVIYHPDAGTDSADKLALLASVVQAPAAPQGTTGYEPARADAHRGESVRRPPTDDRP